MLRSRHWRITDAAGRLEEVRGDGVVVEELARHAVPEQPCRLVLGRQQPGNGWRNDQLQGEDQRQCPGLSLDFEPDQRQPEHRRDKERQCNGVSGQWCALPYGRRARHTVAGDGDPVDVLVVTPFPLFPGAVIRCRPVGVLKMEDDGGMDAKVVAVPVSKLTPLYDKVQSTDDLPELLMQQIEHFFEHYKDLEPGKWVRVGDWYGAVKAKQLIVESIQRAERSAQRASKNAS